MHFPMQKLSQSNNKQRVPSRGSMNFRLTGFWPYTPRAVGVRAALCRLLGVMIRCCGLKGLRL